jgi:hypothetical protein
MKTTMKVCGLALSMAACAPSADESALGSAASECRRLVGAWNYDVPDRTSGVNIAQLTCPSGFSRTLPQIGGVAFASTGPRTLEAHTDQGCTWTFTARGNTAELDPPAQTCFNPVLQSSYTLTRWSVALDGARETEVVEGKSHLPGGDCDFVLADGRRTFVDPNSDADPTTAYVGAWRYVAPDPQTGTNMAQVACSGTPPASEPQAGKVTFAKTGDHAITGHTDQDCVWTFTVQGDTAELDPATQSCGDVTLAHWSMASDGEREFEVVSGTRHTASGDCFVLLGAGERARE